MKELNINIYKDYFSRLQQSMCPEHYELIAKLALALQTAWRDGHNAYFCGNGGSAGNAIHLANDFLYGIAKDKGLGLRVEALSANPAVLTCLANDISYDEIYSQQLRVKAKSKDILIVLSGSGNSPNVVRALEIGNEMDMNTLVHFDCDLYAPTKIALEVLWPRLSRGGVMLFDEYSIHEWPGETKAVDEYFSDKPEVQLKTFSWTNVPAAYIIKN